MPRIPEFEIERLKRDVSLQSLVEASGVKLKKHGTDWIGLCPFHNDTNPSLVVSTDKNLWHCLGACQSGGSVIDWVMKERKVSFRHAVEILRGATPDCSEQKGTTTPPPLQLDTLISHDIDNEATLNQVVHYYHTTLMQSPRALEYLAKRGFYSRETFEHFKIGFANRTLGYRLPSKTTQHGVQVRARLSKLGIMRESGHEHFAGSVIIPIFDEQQNVVEIYGRKVTENLRSGTPDHLYLPGPHRGVWNFQALQSSNEIILCEALIDALTFWQAGFTNVTSSYGIEGFTKDHLAAFKLYDTKRVLIAYDCDAAGEKASLALANKLMEEGIECFRVKFPKSMDANEYALKVKPEKKSLGMALENALWLGKGKAPKRTNIVHLLELSGEFDETELSKPFPLAAIDDNCAKALPTDELLQTEAEQAEASANKRLKNIDAENSPIAKPNITAADTSESEDDLKPTDKPDELIMQFEHRHWRVRGFSRNTTYESLKVNLMCADKNAFHVDNLDLYSARQRLAFIAQAADELGTEKDNIKSELAKLFKKLEIRQDKHLQQSLNPHPPYQMSEQERNDALELLTDPNLFERILEDFDKIGVVGEETNKLLGYIGAASRKFKMPLAIIIQSSSAAGKSSLMDAILSFVPEEERIKFSAMTGQSLFYMGETNLQHKILAIVEEEGAEKASYALKLLQSEGEISIASAGSDPKTGRHLTHEYRVKGPVMILLTTTAIEMDEELLNRFFILSVNEEREQTRAIHQRQREAQTLEGLHASHLKTRIVKLHQNAQRLLKTYPVANPFAPKLTFIDERTRTRRDHQKYLNLISAIALLHQHQREIKSTVIEGASVEYVEASPSDIDLANRLAHQILGRSLDDLPPQTFRVLQQLDEMVKESCQREVQERRDCRFTRREVREKTGLSLTQVQHHMARLQALEYVLVHKGMRGQSFVYELLYDGPLTGREPHLNGLIDMQSLVGECEDAHPTLDETPACEPEILPTTGSYRGNEPHMQGGYRGLVAPLSGPCTPDILPKLTNKNKLLNGSTLK